MDLALFVLHVIVGLLFIGHGTQKLFGWFGGHGLAGTAGFFESIGLRPGRLHAPAAGLAETVGGVLIALGLIVPLGAALIIAVMVAAVLTVHIGNGIWAQDSGVEHPLLTAIAVFALAGIGAGDWSLDAALDIDLASTGWALAAFGAGLVGGLGAVLSGRLAARNAPAGGSAPTAA